MTHTTPPIGNAPAGSSRQAASRAAPPFRAVGIVALVVIGAAMVYLLNMDSQENATKDQLAEQRANELRAQSLLDSPAPADLPPSAVTSPPAGGPTSARRPAAPPPTSPLTPPAP